VFVSEGSFENVSVCDGEEVFVAEIDLVAELSRVTVREKDRVKLKVPVDVQLIDKSGVKDTDSVSVRVLVSGFENDSDSDLVQEAEFVLVSVNELVIVSVSVVVTWLVTVVVSEMDSVVDSVWECVGDRRDGVSVAEGSYDTVTVADFVFEDD
jgi:hypothetical protein